MCCGAPRTAGTNTTILTRFARGGDADSRAGSGAEREREAQAGYESTEGVSPISHPLAVLRPVSASAPAALMTAPPALAPPHLTACCRGFLLSLQVDVLCCAADELDQASGLHLWSAAAPPRPSRRHSSHPPPREAGLPEGRPAAACDWPLAPPPAARRSLPSAGVRTSSLSIRAGPFRFAPTRRGSVPLPLPCVSTAFVD